MAYIGAYFGVPSNASASCCTGPLCNQASPASSSLVCYTCSSSSPGSCANLSVCSPSFTTCGSFAVQILQNGTSTTQYLQTCATPQTCNVPLSISIGVFSATTFSQCCTSSLCNLVNSVQAFTPTSGTLQCYGGVNQQSNVTCRNTEDHCFTVTVSNVATISGCASQSVCANMATTGAYFGLPSNVTASCCTGSFCNRANPVSNSSVCYTCSSSSPGSCARLSVCHPSFTTCGSFAVQLVENGVSSTQYYQSCAYPGICNSPLSFNYGVFSASVNAQCCTTSLCNLVNSVTVSPEAPNSLTCYVGINGAIQGSVQCKGSETLCFTVGLASAGTVRGCTSQGVCDNYVTVLGFFGDTPTTKPICCSGNLCNSSWRPRWSPVLFLLVLTVMTFFY
ncbi:urokinase plasminogen activator surface receptor-like [Polypterus senegalus]|uniref:urokinase plasminogen activator surface receptor-like n=1 Tax=Polypterus senegalus TaxID=55291 RepID=UPI0019669A85|nr:urokinase plasminogen activator surface receptor-like [Polypterus senegalus]